MGFIGVIITIVVGLVVLGFLYGLIGLLMAKFPFLIWTIGGIAGLIIGITSGWGWGVLAGILICGFLSMASTAGTIKCYKCLEHDTEYIGSDTLTMFPYELRGDMMDSIIEGGRRGESYGVYYCKNCKLYIIDFPSTSNRRGTQFYFRYNGKLLK